MQVPERIYIIWDFQTKANLRDNLFYAKKQSKESRNIDFPDPEEGMSQGQIWLKIVKPQLDQATRVIGFMDLPNANVGFELGYAVGLGKKVALAVHLDQLPKWLDDPPFAGFSRRPMPKLSDIMTQADAEDDWFHSDQPFAPGRDVLFLCPPRAGEGYLTTMREHCGWKTLPDYGWPLDRLATHLRGVGVVVWVVLPHTEGAEHRDGSENAALAVVAGYAQSKGISVFPLIHEHARDVADIMSEARRFSGAHEFDRLLIQVKDEIEQRLKEADGRAASDAAVEGPRRRPIPPPLPALDFDETVGKRFVGRRRYLSDFDDALRGLAARSRGEASTGGALVQLIWCHGLGGMGKTWFLRQALLTARERSFGARLALIDWDEAKWRGPLTRYPENQRELYSPIAERVAQLYGVERLDPYWRADERVQAAAIDRAAELNAFQTDLDFAQNERPTPAIGGSSGDVQLAGPQITRVLRTALFNTQLWDGRDPLAPVFSYVTDDEETRERLFRAWCEAKGGTYCDREAVLRPEDLRTLALQECLRGIARERPLLLLLDTCECLSQRLDRCLRRLLAPLCDGNTPLLVVIGSRRPPDVGATAGRDSWKTDVGDVQLRISRFDDVLFTSEEIKLALARTRYPVPDDPNLADAVRTFTRGVPLAVRLLLDMHERGDSILAEVSRGEVGGATGSAGSRAVVIEEVTKRFLLHLSRNRQRDYEDIIALSLLREFDFDTLARLWQTRNVTDRLAQLADRYSLMASGDLHTEVRGFLRKAWRLNNRPDAVGQVIDRLADAVGQIEGADAPGEPGFFELETKKLNMLAWRLEDGFLGQLAPILALALAYGRSVDVLLALVAEVNPSKHNEALLRRMRALAKEAEAAPWRDLPWLKPDLLAWLAEQQALGKWEPSAIGALKLLRGQLFASEEPREALALLKEAIGAWDAAALPRSSEVGSALFSCGSRLYQERDYGRVRQAFELAIRIDYQALAAVVNIGLVCKESGQFDEAERWYRKALEIDPRYAIAYNGLGLLLKKRKRFDDALTNFSKAAELDPAEPLYPRNIGNMCQEREQLDEAERWYRKALQIDLRYATAHNDLGLLFKELKRFDDALTNFSKAAELDPAEPLYPRNIGDMGREREQLDDAESWYRKALQIDPRYATAYNSLGLLFKKRKRFDDALTNFSKAAELKPAEPLYPRNIGNMCQEREQFDEAERWYRKALEIDPRYATAHNDLGLLFKKLKRFDDALANFSKAAELDPAEPLYPRNIGDMCREREQFDEAESWYRKALEIDPR
jgi:tetratricopeptide (TPR) repeat protein